MNDLELELKLERELLAIQAKNHFRRFLDYMDSQYKRQWFHTTIAEYCQRLYEGKIKRLMIFIPSQHGKSLCVSQRFPSWVLGKDPDCRIVGTSYSSLLAEQFSRAIQRNIDDARYKAIFPDTILANGKSGYVHNVDTFEVYGHKGFYKAVGVTGSLTGTPVDIAIIDDPIKDAREAFSPTYRERVWEWYTSVLLTRLHNDSKQLLIMTRWHEDDLAGRLLKMEPEKWVVLSIPAIRESLMDGNDFDPRRVGEALWEERHSREKILAQRSLSERVFSALYQQHPTAEGGNIIKRDWFKMCEREELERIQDKPTHFFIDTAFTEKTSNDPTGIIGVKFNNHFIYVVCATKVHMKFPDLCRFIPTYVKSNGYRSSSSIRIEPKANGLSVIDMLRETTCLNVMETPSPKESKEVRLNAASPIIEAGRVFLARGTWNEEFISEVCGFPTAPHDEYVDVLGYAIDYSEHTGHVLTDKEIEELFF
jgi:predicted phage terminase large subunit-like protein